MTSTTTTQPQRSGDGEGTAAQSSPAEVRFSITDRQHMRYLWQVCDPYLNAVLKQEVLTVSTVDGAVEVGVRSLAQYINEAERQKALAERRAAAAARASKTSREREERTGNNDASLPAQQQQQQQQPPPPPTLLSRSSRSSSSPSSTCSGHTQATGETLASSSPCESGVDEQHGIKRALTDSILVDGALFFALASELYEISRDPFHGGGRAGEVYTLQDHCPGFRLCCTVFAEVYDRIVRPVADKLPELSNVSVDDLLWYRKVVRDTFHLRPDDPNMTGPSESNLDSDWVSENVKKDRYFFNEHSRQQKKKLGTKTSLADITLSTVPYRTRSGTARTAAAKNAAAAAVSVPHQEDGEGPGGENDVRTYYLTELLQNASWEPDDACTQCRQCGSHFKSIAWPFGVRAHHCRSCGHRLCGACISHKAHRSFAKLSKPGSSVEEPDERLVCGPCYKAYLNLERHRYLGALFAFGGLDFANLSLCRTVSRQWRQAAELCISEYRLLLHQCEPDLKSVLTPLGVLLQNSVHLIASVAASPSTTAVKMSRAGRGQTDANAALAPPQSQTEGAGAPLLVSFHPEPALLLLKFIEAHAQWDAPSTRQLLELLAQCTPCHFGGSSFVDNSCPLSWKASGTTAATTSGGRGSAGWPSRRFTHWHFFCTASCSKMLPTFFAVKAAERISAAPATCVLARNALVCLAQNLLSPRVVLRTLNMHGGPRAVQPAKTTAPPPSRFPFSATAPQERTEPGSTTTLDHTAAVANAESVVVWLLDLLFRDAAQRDPSDRKFEVFLESALPPLAAASVPLTIIMLCSLQSVYSFRGYDEELLGLWRTRIWEEVGGGVPELPSRPLPPPSPSSSATSQQQQQQEKLSEEARHDKAAIRRTLEATLAFFSELDNFCARPTGEVRGVILSRWLKEYCTPKQGVPTDQTPTFAVPSMDSTRASGTVVTAAPSPAAATAAAAAATEPNSMYAGGSHPGTHTTSTTNPSSTHRGLATGLFIDLPHPIYHPFKPEILLKSIRVSNIRVEESSSTRPVWLTFSTYSDADRDAFVQLTEAERAATKQARARERTAKRRDAKKATGNGRPHADSTSSSSATSVPTMPAEQLCEFLYKRENAERDQLMCISGRLLQLFLKEEIGDAQLTNYSVLPLSCDSALIEKADGYILSKLPGTSTSADITTFLNTLGDDAKRNFLASAKLFLLMNYIFSIGDRHQGNVMVSFNGAILHIDFGFIFSERTFVEKIAGTTIRVDNQFLAAVASCRRTLREKEMEQQQQQQHRSSATSLIVPGWLSQSATPAGVPQAQVPASDEYNEFFQEAASWFLALRPHAGEFYDLWLYAANRRTLNFEPGDLAAAINCLFDRSASRESSGETFATTMKQSINVCRLKDVTHSGVQALRSYSGHVSKKVSDGSYEVVRSLGSLLSSWKKA